MQWSGMNIIRLIDIFSPATWGNGVIAWFSKHVSRSRRCLIWLWSNLCMLTITSSHVVVNSWPRKRSPYMHSQSLKLAHGTCFLWYCIVLRSPYMFSWPCIQFKACSWTSLVIMHGGPYFPARVLILPVEWGPGVPKFYDTGIHMHSSNVNASTYKIIIVPISRHDHDTIQRMGNNYHYHNYIPAKKIETVAASPIPCNTRPNVYT